MSIPAAIEVQGLCKTYRRGTSKEVVALDHVDLSVRQGAIVGLLGPNGAGKTTTIKCICTLLEPDSGAIRVLGSDARTRPGEAVQHVAAVLEGNRNLHWDLTAQQNLDYYGALQGHSRRSLRPLIGELLERFGLESKRHEEAGRLSRGMQQKLALAAALVRQTPILILDEPTLGLDVDATLDIKRHLQELVAAGKTILLSSHDLDIVQELCESVTIIQGGRIVAADKVSNLLALFRTRVYQVTAGAPLEASQIDRLRAAFPMVGGGAGDTELQVQVADSDGFYVLADEMRLAGIRVERIESLDPDLEQIYVRLMQGGEHGRRGQLVH